MLVPVDVACLRFALRVDNERRLIQLVAGSLRLDTFVARFTDLKDSKDLPASSSISRALCS